jgi:hypothetical protein
MSSICFIAGPDGGLSAAGSGFQSLLNGGGSISRQTVISLYIWKFGDCLNLLSDVVIPFLSAEAPTAGD